MSARTVKQGFFPLDEELALLPGALTPTIHEWLVRLGSWMPFAAATKMLAAISRTQVSEAGGRRKTEAAGAVYVQLQEERVVALEEGRAEAKRGPARLVMTVDGAMVPLVGGEWAEVKTITIGVPEARNTATGETIVQTKEISHFSRLADAQEFTRAALAETEERGLSTAGAVGVVGDGAEWIQGTTDFHRPDAVRVLDFPHAGEKVNLVQQTLGGAGLSLPDDWLNDTLHHLKHAGPADLLADLRDWQQTRPDLPLAGVYNYLEKRANLMDYPAFQAAGWPIGSGSGESANKVVVEARLKGAGMHWQRNHVNPMLGLRNIVCNNRWESAWPLIATRLRQDHRTRRLRNQQQRRAALTATTATAAIPTADVTTVTTTATVAAVTTAPATTAATPPPPVIAVSVPDAPASTTPIEEKKRPRPAANHPWRRSPIGRPGHRSRSPSASAKN